MTKNRLSQKLCGFCCLISLLLFACNDTNIDSGKILKEAEKLVKQDPDSASALLNTILMPNLLDDSKLNLYTLLRSQSNDLLYQDITSDTAIFETKKYYEKTNDTKRTAQACFYSGRVHYEQQDYKQAMQEYLQANDFADKLDNNYELKGTIRINIAHLLSMQNMNKEAFTFYIKALNNFQTDQNIEKSVATYISIGNNYNFSSQPDSAFFYYSQGLELAEKTGHKPLKQQILHNLAVTYREAGNYPEAKKLFRESLTMIDDDNGRAKLYSNLGFTFLDEAIIDSADYYLQKSLKLFDEQTDSYDLAIVYDALSELNEQKKEYRTALDYQKRYSLCIDKVLTESEKNQVLEIQKKYEHQKLVNHNNQLYINRQHTMLFSVIAIFGVIIISLLILSNYHSKLKRKELDLAEAEDKILNLNQLAQSFDLKENTFRSKLLAHFDILKKSAVLEAYMRDEEIKQSKNLLKKFNEIVYKQEELDWDVLYESMNQLHDHFLDKLRHIAPHLDEDEFRICCMIFSDFTNQEIALIMKLSNNTITHKRSSIRKKMKMEDYGNISEFLKKIYKDSTENR